MTRQQTKTANKLALAKAIEAGVGTVSADHWVGLEESRITKLRRKRVRGQTEPQSGSGQSLANAVFLPVAVYDNSLTCS